MQNCIVLFFLKFHKWKEEVFLPAVEKKKPKNESSEKKQPAQEEGVSLKRPNITYLVVLLLELV